MVHPFCWELSDAMEQNIYKYRPFSHSKKEPQVLFKHSPWHYSSLPLFKNWDVLPCKAGYSSFLRQIGDLEIQISCLNYKSKTRSSDIFQKDQVTSNKMRRYKKTRKDTPFHMVHPFCWVLVRKNIFWVVEFFYSLCDDAFSKLPLPTQMHHTMWERTWKCGSENVFSLVYHFVWGHLSQGHFKTLKNVLLVKCRNFFPEMK